MRNLKPVKDNKDLVRDEVSGAIIDLNVDKLRQAKRQKIERLKKLQEQDAMRDDINSLKQDMLEIKTVLQKLIEKL